MRRAHFLSALRQDLILAFRTMRRSPGFSAGVVGLLALGIGANAAIFTLTNALLFRSLPVADPHRLVSLGDTERVFSVAHDDSPRADLYSYLLYTDVRDHGGSLAGVLATGRSDRLDVVIDSGGVFEHPRARYVSPNYFEVLGVAPHLGRTFPPESDRSAAPVVVISHRWWTRRFNGDPSVVDREIIINGVAVAIIGVAPQSFSGEVVGLAPDLWIPLDLQPSIMPHETRLDDREISWLLLLGRLAPGVTLSQARADLEPFVRRRLAEHASLPGSAAVEAAERAPVPIAAGSRGFSWARGTYRVPLLTLLSGVGILLLIICANASNLMLARAVSRGREIGVRMAIGADRIRLVRQLLTESLALGAVGVAGGLVLAWGGSRLLLRIVSDGGNVIPLDTPLDLRVLGFTAAIALVAVLLSGLTPALRASRVNVVQSLKSGAGMVGGPGSRGQRMPLGRLLIAGQVALSIVMLIGAALFVRNARALEVADAGLDRDRLLIVEVDAAGRGYLGDRQARLAQELADRFSRLPGAVAVSYSENGIFSGHESALTLRIPEFSAKSASDTVAYFDQVGPGYFAAIGGRVLRGREFTDRDHTGAEPVIVINETMARFYYGDLDPVGRTVYFDDTTMAAVVGVVADVTDQDLTAVPRRRFYFPFLQRSPAGSVRFEIRSAADPALLIGPVRDAITAVDPLLGIDGIDPLSELMRRSIREERLLAKLAGGFGVLALSLAAVGLYGVMSYAVTRRTSEIGLRMALGARRGDVVGMVVGEALGMVAIGAAAGVPLALAIGRILRSQLSTVSATDPTAFLVALGVLGGAALAAALVPALRAGRVAPLVALRAE